MWRIYHRADGRRAEPLGRRVGSPCRRRRRRSRPPGVAGAGNARRRGRCNCRPVAGSGGDRRGGRIAHPRRAPGRLPPGCRLAAVAGPDRGCRGHRCRPELGSRRRRLPGRAPDRRHGAHGQPHIRGQRAGRRDRPCPPDGDRRSRRHGLGRWTESGWEGPILVLDGDQPGSAPELDAADPSVDADIGPDTVAHLAFTSGTTRTRPRRRHCPTRTSSPRSGR